MNRLLIATLTILLVLSTVPAMGQRWVERQSTYPDDRDLDRVSFAGEITSIDGQIASIRTDEGAIMRVHLGPRWFWYERGYRLRTGLHVEVSGWFDDEDESSRFAGYISGDGFHFELSDSDGYPLWARENRDDWRPRRDIIVNHYWNPPPRRPVWWHAPRYHYWDRHSWHRPHHDYYRGPRWHHPGHPGPGHDGPRHDGDRRQRGGRRGD